MHSRVLACSLFALIASTAARAGDLPPSQDGAARLLATAQQFLGVDGANRGITISPDAQGYQVEVDMQRLLAPLASVGFEFGPYRQSLTLVEQDDGGWRVAASGMPTVSAGMKDGRSVRLETDNYHFEGVWDPALAAFRSWDQGWTAMRRFTQDKELRSELAIAGGAGAEGADVGPNGGVSMLARFATGPFKQTVTSTRPGFAFTVAADSGRSDTTFHSLHSKDLLNLWSFAVSHADKTPTAAEMQAFKASLRSALPIFQRFEQQASANNLAVDTAAGSFGAGSVRFGWSTDGIIDGGSMNVSLGVESITAPDGAVPAWAVRLVPTQISLSQSVSGYDFVKAANALIDAVDLSRKPAVSEEDMKRIGAMILARGPVHLRIDPSEVRSAAYDLKVEGDMDFKTNLPSGTVTVRMDGLDQVVAAVQSAKDPRAQQATMGLMMAKAFARPENGGHVWVVAFQDGKVTVNGKAIGR